MKKNGEDILSLIKERLRKEMKGILEGILNTEISLYLGRNRYERKGSGKEKNYRNGFQKEREFTIKGIGSFKITVPRDRKGGFESQVIPKYRRSDWDFSEEMQVLFLSGISTRRVEEISEKLFGKTFSGTEVSEPANKLTEEMAGWRNRWLYKYIYKDKYIYLYIDGVNFHMNRMKAVVNAR